MLAGDRGQLGRRRFQPLRILGRVAHPDVQHDLLEPRNLMRVLEPKLLLQLGAHLLLVEVPQPGPWRGLDRLSRSLGCLLLRRFRLALCAFLRLVRAFLRLWLFLLLLFFVRHTYLTRGIGWPDFTAIRSSFPSLS